MIYLQAILCTWPVHLFSKEQAHSSSYMDEQIFPRLFNFFGDTSRFLFKDGIIQGPLVLPTSVGQGELNSPKQTTVMRSSEWMS